MPATYWTYDELENFDNAREVELITRRRDGSSRPAVTIWIVRVRDDLYIRSWRGARADWFRAVEARPEAHISRGFVDKDVVLIADHVSDDEVDEAYRRKYGGSSKYADAMVAPEARVTTLRLVPHEHGLR
jgi:hypothetical protein